jgi:hypothetical protein
VRDVMYAMFRSVISIGIRRGIWMREDILGAFS